MPRKRNIDTPTRQRDMRLGEAIRAYRERRGWTATKLATIAGLSQSYINRLERAQTGYSPESISAVAGALGVSLEKLFAAISTSNVELVTLDQREIPVLDYVQAGAWQSVQQGATDAEVQEKVMVDVNYPPSVFGLRIKGDSMTPEFNEGDLVIIAPTIAPRPGDFVVATDSTGDATFKQYRDAGMNEDRQRVFELIPLNPHYGPRRSDREPIAIVGTMIEHRRFRKR